MGRTKKYPNGSSLITLSMDNDVIDAIDIKARKVGKNRSAFITEVCKHIAMSDKEFCSLKARQAAQDMHYWNSRAESLKEI